MSEKKGQNFEQNIKKLQEIVDKLSEGDIGINDSIDLYKKGLELVKTSYDQLKKNEHQVKVISEEMGDCKLSDFNE